MQQVAQKPRRKFCGQKAAKKRKTHPEQPEKGETGCVLGAEGDGNGCEQVRTDGKTRSSNQSEPHSRATQAKRKPAKTQCFRRFLAGAEGLVSAAASVGPGRSPPGCRPPRHAPQAGLRAHLVAKSYRTLTKKSGIASAVPDFFGRGRRTWSRLPPRSVRSRAPLALAHPSARGFGVDVGERTREREKADVIRFPPQVPERAVLVWCCELFLEKDCVSTTTSSFERKAPPPGGWPS